MNSSERIRQSYERLPYPAVKTHRATRPQWRIAPLEWIEAMCPGHAAMRRILVAGCGTGNEAFALRRKLPKAEIVAIDFSPRSLAIARQTQRQSSRGRAIQFLQADLTSDRFAKIVGREFDFISCHGVLSYIPNTPAALKNLSACLAPDGAFYLGANGIRHLSTNWRPALEDFGFKLERFEDSRALRQALTLLGAIGDDQAKLEKMPPEYLAGDLFGSFIANRALGEWVALGQRCGLNFRGSYIAHRNLARALNSDRYELLLPRSRAEAHRLTEQIAPSPFHHAVFTKKETPSPWADKDLLLRARISLTSLYQFRLPRRGKAKRGLQSIRLTSPTTNTLVDVQVPSWLPEILRIGVTKQSIRELLRGRRVSFNSLREHFYLLELLGAINVEAT